MAVEPKDIAEKALSFSYVDDIEARILARAYLQATKPTDATTVPLDKSDKMAIKELAQDALMKCGFDRHYDEHTIIVDAWIEAVDTVRRNKKDKIDGKTYKTYKEYD